MPPGVPAERLAAMRKALAETFADPEFLAESKRLGLGADTPQSGEQIAGVIRRVYGTTPHVLDRLRKLNKVPRPDMDRNELLAGRVALDHRRRRRDRRRDRKALRGGRRRCRGRRYCGADAAKAVAAEIADAGGRAVAVAGGCLGRGGCAANQSNTQFRPSASSPHLVNVAANVTPDGTVETL